MFHDFNIVILSFILVLVGWFLVVGVTSNLSVLNISERHVIECVWTFFPALVLSVLAVPSLYLLYMRDESLVGMIGIKVIGHQWYWSYSYDDFLFFSDSNLVPDKEILRYDSYMLRGDETVVRLLDTDNRVCLPYNVPVCVLVSSSDVLHSWTVPALGVKADAVPGRLNQLIFTRYRPGVFFGQCSEICGANHRFIPISLEFVSSSDFLG